MNEAFDNTRTIIALATSMGSGSISVIRISGKDAISLVNKVFIGKDLIKAKANTIHFGKLFHKRKEIDQVLVSLFRSPHSYTGEDSIEISCHANPYIVNDIIECLIELGADQAKAGEFTLRAFLNGKIDLSRAEAVSNIIQAKSKAGVNNAIQQLEGRLYNKINFYRQEIIDTIAQLEIDLDFSEENIIIALPKEIINTINTFETEVAGLIASYNYAKILSSGITMTIIGSPNVGKSTLLNTLLGEKRAITSHIPGTQEQHATRFMNIY
jgi:tRNA modification GTPase